MRNRYYDHYPDPWSDHRSRYDRLYRRPPRYRRGRRIAYDAGEEIRPRRGEQRWRRYLAGVGRLKERRRPERWDEIDSLDESEDQDLVRRGRRFARRYREPIVGAALASAALPAAIGFAGGPGSPEEGSTEGRIHEAMLPQRPMARGDLEDDVRSRLASLREGRIRSATIEGAMTAYDIPRGLAAQIHDIAVANDIEPELAFGLVKTESSFDDRAVSNVGARGLTQVMPRTARWLRPGTTIEDLYNRNLNLDLGFGYLRDLIDKYDGDIRLALLAYNRGPGTVDRVLSQGGDPDNGYADLVLEGYTDLS